MYTSLLQQLGGYKATLVAVSKTKPVSDINDLYDQGQRHFGENKVQELVDKYHQCPKDIHWHLIGSLQSNKVKYIAPFVYMIHSVDKESLLKEINKQGEKAGRIIPILLQVKIAEEDTKQGASKDEVLRMASQIAADKYPYTSLRGLMGMATFTDNQDQIEREFLSLSDLFETLKQQYPSLPIDTLSMGMSGDYEIALKAGSNMIRVGSLLFGSR